MGKIYDAFEDAALAKSVARDLRKIGHPRKLYVRKIKPQGGEGGRLKYGLFER
jgi:hypothetical protein